MCIVIDDTSSKSLPGRSGVLQGIILNSKFKKVSLKLVVNQQMQLLQP